MQAPAVRTAPLVFPACVPLGKALHTALLAGSGSFCLRVVRVVTVIKPPATWPQRLARMVVTTPTARAGAPEVCGGYCPRARLEGWAQARGPPCPPNAPTPGFLSLCSPQAPLSPHAGQGHRQSPKPAPTGDATLGITLQRLGTICPAHPPTSSKHQVSSRLPETSPEPGASVGPHLSWTPAWFLPSPRNASPPLHPAQGRDTRRVGTRNRPCQPPSPHPPAHRGQSPELLGPASRSSLIPHPLLSTGAPVPSTCCSLSWDHPPPGSSPSQSHSHSSYGPLC